MNILNVELLTSSDFIHPSKKIFASYSNRLEGKKIALGITASIASYLSPKIARELMRHGADVIPIMTENSLSMIGKDLMWWATGNEPIINVSGNLEHIQYAGIMNNPIDLMLIAPCTTNTVAKLATGISDTSVTLIASTIAGKHIPIMVLCVAHEDLINSPATKENMAKIRKNGIAIIDPVLEEGKAKMPEIDDIILAVFEKIESNELNNRNVIITGGPTREFIDDVRFISNPSSGKTALELAKESLIQGADVQLVLGPTIVQIPKAIRSINVITSQEMTEKVLSLLDTNPNSIVILASAMSDFTVSKKSGKIKSGNSLILDLMPTQKLSSQIKEKYPKSTLILYKAESGLSKEDLIKSATKKLEIDNADLIIANDISQQNSGFESDNNQVIIINKTGSSREINDSKSFIAKEIISEVIKLI
ncbi:MAG: Coenzyme A biosynthesis bifunctional protein CoaBC [Candidatus Heimdallarchaeota archaeon LC_2]|nr:MAG: Coenzyme A biosynthesis bifunctional protein CoaBC [Candidatus Heimdallarchaeota archaeon LC_2]OLS28576.1 MAG: Coenzyme A biosynthesis bifunctional protein CoaBC [Candidatus Heimdallarchaeota archaeon LC_2]